MRGLENRPSPLDLVHAYNELQSQTFSVATLLKFAPWARFDPRLAEILVAQLAARWSYMNPFELYLLRESVHWPSVFGVLIDEAESLVSSKDRRNFRLWKLTVLHELAPANGEVFWIGLHRFGSRLNRSMVERSLKTYSRWGYFGADRLINKFRSRDAQRTTMAQVQRREILRKLAASRDYFGLQDYLEALSGGATRRVACNDLSSADFLKCHGQTKGRKYRLRVRR